MKKTTLYTTLAVTLSSLASLQATVLATNSNGGFGNVLSGSALEFTDDGTTLTICWETGGGAFNDNLVFYFDTAAGGAADTSGYTDTMDQGRAAISGTDGTNVSVLTFGGGFTADSALSVDNSFAGYFDGLGASHNFVSSAGLAGTGTNADPYKMTLLLSDMGVTPGDSFDIVATYLNGSNAFRSDEALTSAALAAGNPGAAATSFAGSDTHTTQAIPEPTSLVLLSLSCLSFLRRRR